jgi:hypothetical protein
VSEEYELNSYDDMEYGEKSYGLCNSCANNDGEGKCDKYKMPLSMVQRKKKCKYFHEQGTCWTCKTFLEDFVIWDDQIKASWKFSVCFKCGTPFVFGSKKLLSHILFKIIQWRYPLSQDHGTHYMMTRKSKDYIKILREYQKYYFAALKKWRENS